MGTWYIPSLLDFNSTGKYCAKMVFDAINIKFFNVSIISYDPDNPVSASNVSDSTRNSLTTLAVFSKPGVLLFNDVYLMRPLHMGIT